MEADYSVKTKVSFQLTFDDREFNVLLLKDVQKAFAQHVKEVYERDDTLREYIDGDLNFHFDNRTVQLEYDFVCCDESRAEAESFSEYCVRCVKKELEEFGCQVKRVTCRAEEQDMSWLDALEDQIFGPRSSAPKQEQNLEKNSEKITSKSSKKKGGRSER